MGDFKKLIVKEYPKTLTRLTPDARFWQKFKFVAAVKEFGAVSHISFASDAPYHYAITSGTKVNIYNCRESAVQQSISRFRKTAYSGCLRRDGKLLVAGSEDHSVTIFEVGTRSILRELIGHARPVHFTRFDEGGVQVLSGSDDKTLRCWDLATGNEVSCFKGHEDYIRCGYTCPASPDIWLTGSYDHSVRVWDKRSGEAGLTLDHGSPVESVVVLPSGTIAISAGSNKIKVWDLHRGSLLSMLSNHQKTVSCLAVCGEGTRLMSGSLDHQVKMYDLADYTVTHSIKYPSPVLALGTTATNSHLVVGSSDGLVNIREHPTPKAQPVKRLASAITPGTPGYFARGKNFKPSSVDKVVVGTKRKKLAKYDVFLKRFQYTEAFDSVIANRHNPELVVSVIQELFRRDAVKKVLSGRDEETLKPLLQFLVSHITNPKYSAVLCDVAHIMADLYSPIFGLSPTIDGLIAKLNKRIAYEMRVQEQYMKLQGAIECFFAATCYT